MKNTSRQAPGRSTRGQHLRGPQQQRGAVLAVALILLLALTVLGVAALSANKLQTRLAYNASESTVAFQAAETALAAGEIWLATRTTPPPPGCVATGCPTNTSVWDKTTAANTASLDNLLDATWWSTNGRKYGFGYEDGVTPTLQSGQSIPGVSTEPRYIVQYIGVAIDGSLDPTAPPGPYYYEISARGTGALAEDNTVVQSVYAVRY